MSPPTTPAKRPVRTYGRPKPTTEVPASTSSHHIPDSISKPIISYSLSSDALGEAPANSNPSSLISAEVAEEEKSSDDESRNDASTKFNWGWKAKLEDLDKSDDENESAGQPEEAASSRVISQQGPKLVDSAPLSLEQTTSQESRHLLDAPPSPSQGVFPSSGSTLPPSPSPKSRRVSKHKRVIDSDAESDQEQSKSSYPSSPAKDTINTPKTRSSITPPTSGDEMPSAKLPKSKPSSKGKLTATPLVFVDDDASSSKPSKGKRAKPNKIKPPTKKDKVETVRESHRLNAAKQVSIAPAQRSNKHTLQNLLAAVSHAPSPLKGELSIDPISEFSSPNGHVGYDTTPFSHVDDKPSCNIPLVSLDSDEELPSVQTLLDAKKAKDIKALKLKAAQQQQQRSKGSHSDDDDDLEIVDGPTDTHVAMMEERKPGRPSITVSKRTQQKLAGIPLRRPSPARSTSQARNAKQLNQVLLKDIQTDNARRTKEKSEEWERRGGRPLESGVQPSAMHGVERYVQKGLENLEKSKVKAQEGSEYLEEDEDEEDQEWTPDQRGFASPVPRKDEYEENRGDETEDYDMTMVDEEASVEEDDLTQIEIPHRRPLRARAVVGSDTEDEAENLPQSRSFGKVLAADSMVLSPIAHHQSAVMGSDTEEENNENVPPQSRSFGKVLVADSMVLPPLARHQSDSSHDGATEDEGDKENNDRLMYDHSDDKENTAVVRYGVMDPEPPSEGSRPSLGRRRSGLFNREENMRRSLSMSPGAGYTTEEDKENPRSPLKTLSTAELPLTPSVPFAARLQQAASAATIADDNPEPSSTFVPRVLARDPQASGFSQFSEDGESQPKKLLEASFSDLFDSDSQKPSASSRPALGSFKEPAKPNNFLDKLRGNKSLGLTQDLAVGLQPALEVNENLKRQAQQIFEKEQDFILNNENHSTAKQPELYINEQGFLTQTRPADGAEIYRPPPTPSQPFSQMGAFTSQSISRQPFRELPTPSVDDDPPRLQRLRKRGLSRSPFGVISQSDIGGRASTSSSPPLSPTELKKLRQKTHVPKPRQRLEKSAFVESEAQESDEDEMFGFRKRDEGDEEDGEDQDRTLETLVDDKDMDHTEIAEEKVVEKYQEHRQEDDARDEQLANAVIQGQKRFGKRNRDRAGIDDSDEDEDEDERNRRIRRKMKEPELRGDIKSLAGQEATRAFAEQYQAAIKSDGDPELAHLQGDDNNNDVTMAGPDDERDEEDEDAGSDNDENNRFISRDEVIRQAREAARKGEDEGPDFNPHDTSFVDANDDEDEDLPRVRNVTTVPPRNHGIRKGFVDALDIDAAENHRSESMVDVHGRKRAEAFVKSESRLRRTGTARPNMSGGISVIGPKSHAKTGAIASQVGNNISKRQPVKAAPSMLNQVGDRKDRFQ